MPLPTPCCARWLAVIHAHSQDYEPPPEWTAFSLRLQRAGVEHKNRTVAVLTNAELCWVARTVSAELKARKRAGKLVSVDAARPAQRSGEAALGW